MMISSSALYWLLKLDDFRDLLAAVIGVTVFLTVVSGFVALMAICESDDELRKCIHARCRSIGGCAAWVLAVAVVLRVLLPSTKQAAVIYAVPAVMNSGFVTEEVPAEARELYGLAKRWLTEKAEASETAEKESK